MIYYTLVEGMDRKLLDYLEFHFQLVPLVPHLAIAKTILVKSLIFNIFTRVEN